jgi:TolA-binding protein
MEWVIAVLAVGCLFFAFQVVMDYIKYRAVVEPRLRQLEEAKEDLRARIAAAEQELGQRRDQLEPLKGEIDGLEQEFRELQRQIETEKAQQQGRSLLPRRGLGRTRPR